MATICPRCHLEGKRVEMTPSFLRLEKRLAEFPCDEYPDGTVITGVERMAEAPVYRFECPICSLAVERQASPDVPTVPESP